MPAPMRDPEAHPAMARLERALDRISGSVVRRIEHEATRADQPREPIDEARSDEVRQRLDGLIARLRAVLADSAREPGK